ncbi:ASKHA domain-containing protein [Desulfobaculum bizertense]|uniref:Uncharacterized 2Fe-2 and 4Fe-4S clusters-containing protein, contains DUF4445 domain n=1 Tax=Desulfobaculum bizertense DSM 18034 TaxID=1121442 RepID=A0A1T4WHT4_9BACT|nr:ASKHA domain-containing protein [Desulfobaculum bizertense]SKA76221.1 Uncharacterized 2Fe-2 and 4Fe-4S clusters-containing protein, contains DUF4445 domain [Desulfobaculum bizertense DSM 18034]
MPEIRLTVLDADHQKREMSCEPGQTLAQGLFLSGYWKTPVLCSGVGLCGRCRLRFLSPAPAPDSADEALFSVEELHDGWRLGCRHQVREGQEVFLPCHAAASAAPQELTPDAKAVRLAVDFGTSSVSWQALDGERSVAQGTDPNPQLGAGSDVMSRLAYAADPDHARQLQKLAVSYLQQVVAGLGAPVEEIAVAANPAMTLILLGKESAGLRAAPYRLSYRGGQVEILEALPPVYVLPQLAPFVGGDLSAGLLELLERNTRPQFPFLLSDMGTNGEFVLAVSPERFLVTSVPLGPALEGAGLSCGNAAGPGAVVHFEVQPAGLVAQCLGGGMPSRKAGMTGTGYISLLALLRQLGVLAEDGRFEQGNTPLAKRVSRSLGTQYGEPCLHLPGGLVLLARDVEEILKIKAAFHVALDALCEAAGIRLTDLAAVYLAGALGENVSCLALEQLGFLPEGSGRLVQSVGNTSLAGAARVLYDKTAREKVESFSKKTQEIVLAGDRDFSTRFMARMRFSQSEAV